MSDENLGNVTVVLNDWRGRIVWNSPVADPPHWGQLAWANLDEASQQKTKDALSKVVTLRESQKLKIVNAQGRHLRCWMWPLESPDIAVCSLVMEVPKELDELTEREQTCLEMLAQGMETRKIAEQMDVTVSTVHSHLKSVREKLGLPTIEALISFAARYCFPQSLPLYFERSGAVSDVAD